MSNDRKIIEFDPKSNSEMSAADWLARLDRGSLTSSEKEELAKWLSEEPGRYRELHDLSTFWFGLNIPLSQIDFVETQGSNRISWIGFSDWVRSVTNAKSYHALVAGVFLTLFSFTALAILSLSLYQPSSGYYATRVGEMRTIELPDGSQVNLNTNTRLEYRYSSRERSIQLLSGEAIFDVAHKANWPFVVYAQDGVIQAVGTRFVVRVNTEKVMIAVQEGKVDVRNRDSEHAHSNGEPSARTPSALRVSQGEATDIEFSTIKERRRLTEDELTERLSWLDGQLVFYDEELPDVIEQVARYTTVEIEIDAAQLRERKITGVLPIGDVSLMLEGIEAALGVKADWVEPNVVRLTNG